MGTPKIRRQVYKFDELEIGDCFYFLGDTHKKVWEMVDDRTFSHFAEVEVLSPYEVRSVVYMRSKDQNTR